MNQSSKDTNGTVVLARPQPLVQISTRRPFLVTIPHSGEKIPPQANWLNGLPETLLMCDVDRYVDLLYGSSLDALQIPYVLTEWHRYAADLNRVPEDVDSTSVQGNVNPAGLHNRGFHWVVTTHNEPILKAPMSVETHQELVDLVYVPFHAEIQKIYRTLESAGHKKVYHLDAHSMPSVGTQMHRDPGERRADIVVSDCSGKSCSENYLDLVLTSYIKAGFKVAYNWPYMGGRVTEMYGHPQKNHEALQVELNRDLYMDEATKKLKPTEAQKTAQKINKALTQIAEKISRL